MVRYQSCHLRGFAEIKLVLLMEERHLKTGLAFKPYDDRGMDSTDVAISSC